MGQMLTLTAKDHKSSHYKYFQRHKGKRGPLFSIKGNNDKHRWKIFVE